MTQETATERDLLSCIFLEAREIQAQAQELGLLALESQALTIQELAQELSRRLMARKDTAKEA